MVVTDFWSAEAEQVLEAGGADGLDLNYAKGFKDTDLGFVKDWPLRRVTILARTVKDLSPLYSLAGTLESLSVQTSPSAEIDLARFTSLRSLGADWSQVQESVGDVPGLRDLFLLSYGGEDLGPLRWNSQLERLRFKDRPRLRSLDGLHAFPSIHHLGVYLASRLQDIRALHDLQPSHLEELHVESCPIRSLEPVAAARSLRFLNASNCGEIESLHPLQGLRSLETLWLFGSTKVGDDDLSPILGLPNLRELRMQSRRTYSPSVKQVQAQIATPGS